MSYSQSSDHPFGYQVPSGALPDHSSDECGRPDPRVPVTTSATTSSQLAVTISAGADAYGQDTFASVTANVHIFDRGLASFVSGSVTAVASAVGGPGYADAYAQVGLAGADVAVAAQQEAASPDGSYHAVTTDFAGIDLKFDWKAMVSDSFMSSSSTLTTDNHSSISGNVASFQVDLLAAGPNSYVDVAADALTVENTLSSTTVSATAAIDSTISYSVTCGSSKADHLAGTAGMDLISAGSGNDDVCGREGNDWIFGNSGHDSLDGGLGDDTLLGGNGRDVLHGGDGDDWLFGGSDSDDLDGGDGRDLLYGGRGCDILHGGAGEDLLAGGVGSDRLFGDAGCDVFRLGAQGCGDGGDDTYVGGTGADTYLVTGRFDKDTVLDFSVKDGDRIALDGDASRWCISMRVASCDADDLEIRFSSAGEKGSTLVLDEFFRSNTGLISPGSHALTLAQTDLIMHVLISDGVSSDAADPQLFLFGDMISMIG